MRPGEQHALEWVPRAAIGGNLGPMISSMVRSTIAVRHYRGGE